MRKTHRIWILLLTVLLLSGLFACKRTGSNTGGSGETVDFGFADSTNGVPTGWSIDSYEGRYTAFTENGVSGFSVNGIDDCRLVRSVQVEEKTRYVLTAEVATENVAYGQGATLSIDNFSVDGSFIYSEALFGTNDWTTVTLAFCTGESQTLVTLALRLGGYSAESSGSVRFKNVRLTQTDNAPVAFQNLVPYTQSSTDDDRTAEDYETFFTVIFWAGAIAAIVLLFGVAPKVNSLKQGEAAKHWYLQFAAIVLVGLVVRFLLCAKFRGHSTDMVCWWAWGRQIVEVGPHGFYNSVWCDYPPGYMLVCGLLNRIAPTGGVLSPFFYMLPAFLCDVLSGFLIVNRAKRFALSDRMALWLSALIVLNPAAVYLSGAWGQIDSILTVMLIGTFMLLNESRERPYYRLFAGILYGLAILTKWQALIFGPVLALMYFMTGIDQWRTKRFWLHVLWSVAAVLGAIGVLLLASVLFRGEGMRFLWMVDKYNNSSTGYEYASIEAYNYMTLFGGNWAAVRNSLFGTGNVWQMFLRVNVLFSKIALLVGFPTLILRAWKSMRIRTDKQKNTAFYELLTASVVALVLSILTFVAKNYTSENGFAAGILKAVSAFPLYGLLMLGLFAFVVYRESRGQKLLEWFKTGSVSAVGAATLFTGACVFGLTFLLGALFRLFGMKLSWPVLVVLGIVLAIATTLALFASGSLSSAGAATLFTGACVFGLTFLLGALFRISGMTLTWHAFGVFGIVLAGALTLALFTIYMWRLRSAGHSLYNNRGLIFLLAACFCVWVFTFGHYMHERYIFPALFFLVFAYAYDRDPHKLYALCMLSVTTFLNEMMAMFVVSEGANDLVRGGVIHNQLIGVISLLEVGAVCYLTAITFLRALRFDTSDPREEGVRIKETPRRKKGGRR